MFGDMGKMMKQVAEMKSKMSAADKELKKTEVEGTSKDGRIKVKLNGKMQLSSVTVEDDKELARSIEEAVGSALQNASSLAQDKLKGVTGGVNIPGLT